MNGEETAANNSSIYGDAESLRLIHIKLDAGEEQKFEYMLLMKAMGSLRKDYLIELE